MQAAADRLEVEQKLHKKNQKPQKSMKEVREEGLAAPIATDNKYGAQAAKRSQTNACSVCCCWQEGVLPRAAVVGLLSHARLDELPGAFKCWLQWDINRAKV